MPPILERIPVRSLVNLILDYSMDLRPIMDTVIRDITSFRFRNNPSSYLDYKRRMRDQIRELTGSDDMFVALFAHNCYMDAEDICTQHFNRCDSCDSAPRNENLDFTNNTLYFFCMDCSSWQKVNFMAPSCYLQEGNMLHVFRKPIQQN